MRICYNRAHKLYRVTYTEVDAVDYLAVLKRAEYRVTFGAYPNNGYVAFPARYAASVHVETDAGGANFVFAAEGEEQALCRDFTSLLLLGGHALDCLPWYAVKGQRWTLEITDEDERRFTLNNRSWDRLAKAQNLKELAS